MVLLLAGLVHAEIRINVLEGQNAVNEAGQPSTHDPVVQVVDESGAPIQGAPVVFILPVQGPGGVFANGSTTLTVTTDRDGRATGRGIRLNPQTGSFQIRVSASYQGQNASAIVNQTSVAGLSSSQRMSPRKFWIILAVAAGAAAAGSIVAVTRGGSSGSSNAPIVITPGTPTVGGPH